MTGPEHYREAERLLESLDAENVEQALMAAQVHATLALAAATITRDGVGIDNEAELIWSDVVFEKGRR